MIPLKIQLKNFLSYGNSLQTVDFGTHGLVCLAGKNGHGKSALLDAITWALWGHARKVSGTSKPDEGLLRLGQSQMLVALDFICNGQSYRVRREFTLHATRPVTNLDFGIIDPATDRFTALTDKTMRATQEIINRTIGFDYDAFTNSVFLRQGQSNEFSKKSPKERKEIICAILGINHYEDLRRLALERIRALSAEKDIINALLAPYADLSQRLTQARTQKAQLELLRTEQQHEEQILFGERSQIEAEKQKILSQTTSVNLEAREKLALQEATLAHLHEKLMHHATLTTTCTALEKRIRERTDELSLAVRNVEQEEMRIAQQHAMRDALIRDESRAQEKRQQDIAVQEQTVITLAQEIKQCQEIELRFERRKKFYHAFAARLEALTVHYDAIVREKNTVDTEMHCPLCTQQVIDDIHAQVHDTLEKKLHRTSHQQKRLHSVLEQLKKILVHDREQIAHLTVQKNRYAQAAATHAEQKKSYALLQGKIQEQRQELEKLTSALIQARAMLEKARRHITEDSSLHALTQELLETQKNIALLRAETDHYAQVMQTVSELRAACAQESPTESLAWKQLVTQEKLLALKLQECSARKEQFLIVHTALEHELKSLEKAEIESAAQIQNRDALTLRIEEYTLAAHVLSKEGIQALLIEEAIPEIEHEANALLGKLTDNQAHLSIESLRDLKSGGTKETLDIKISDAMGIRPYELFSGGEAFRIDLALRIAISKLVARRAGASLQTLIIDEGFGSQDEEGISHIMDALYRIQEDFAKIIVVSHLPSMKDQFPVQFFVHKTPHGSTVQIFQQG